jgi:hypothetical protein
MADWTYIPDEKAYWRPNTKSEPLPELKPAHNHKLEYQRGIDRWVCKCGYKLGDGRELLLAPCPLGKKTDPRFDDRFPLPIKKDFLQGELLPPLEEEPTAATNKRKKQTNGRPVSKHTRAGPVKRRGKKSNP